MIISPDAQRGWGLFRDNQKASGCGPQQLPPGGSTWGVVGPDGPQRVLPPWASLWFVSFFPVPALFLTNTCVILMIKFEACLLVCLWWNKLHYSAIDFPVSKPCRCWWQNWTCRRRFPVVWDALPEKWEWWLALRSSSYPWHLVPFPAVVFSWATVLLTST